MYNARCRITQLDEVKDGIVNKIIIYRSQKNSDNLRQNHIGIQVDLSMEIRRKYVATLYPRKNLTRIGTL